MNHESMMDTVTVKISMREDYYHFLRELADERDMSLSEVLDYMITKGLDYQHMFLPKGGRL